MNPTDLTTPEKETLRTQTAAVITPGTPARRPASETQTPIAIWSVIQRISEFAFSPQATPAMYSPQSPQELPSLKTEKWSFACDDQPNPMSINMAQKLLAAGYAQVTCDLKEAGSTHGYAWIIDTNKRWLQCQGTSPITPPMKPDKEYDYYYSKQMEYADQTESYQIYHHLLQAGTSKITEWFGTDLFVDLHKEGVLPVTTTPKKLLEHLAGTYGQGGDYQCHMETIEAKFNSPYNAKQPLETYF